MDNNDDNTNTFVAKITFESYCLTNKTVVVAAGIAVNKTHTFLHNELIGKNDKHKSIKQGIIIRR